MARLMDVNGLTVRFYTPEGTVYAVNDVTYTLDEGESLAIVGESGSGKSVHALAIMGPDPQPTGQSYQWHRDVRPARSVGVARR